MCEYGGLILLGALVYFSGAVAAFTQTATPGLLLKEGFTTTDALSKTGLAYGPLNRSARVLKNA
jgi:hypothetical protein